jgi:hypothetical protein
VQIAAKLHVRRCAVLPASLTAACAGLVCICFTGLALAKDDDDGSSNGASKTPNIYLDMRTSYANDLPARCRSDLAVRLSSRHCNPLRCPGPIVCRQILAA